MTSSSKLFFRTPWAFINVPPMASPISSGISMHISIRRCSALPPYGNSWWVMNYSRRRNGTSHRKTQLPVCVKSTRKASHFMLFLWPSAGYLLGVPRQEPGEIRFELTSQSRLDPVHTCHPFDPDQSARRQIDDWVAEIDGAEKRRCSGAWSRAGRYGGLPAQRRTR